MATMGAQTHWSSHDFAICQMVDWQNTVCFFVPGRRTTYAMWRKSTELFNSFCATHRYIWINCPNLTMHRYIRCFLDIEKIVLSNFTKYNNLKYIVLCIIGKLNHLAILISWNNCTFGGFCHDAVNRYYVSKNVLVRTPLDSWHWKS